MTRRIKSIIRASVQIVIVAVLLSLFSCSSRKNTSSSRMVNSFKTRYNVLFNAEKAYNKALEQQQKSTEDNFQALLPLYSSSSQGTGERENGPFDQAIGKSLKAIELYSIRDKPKSNPTKKGDVKYREWLKKKEFNPYIQNAWLLMAKSHFFNRNFKEASSIFLHISHLYSEDKDISTEARIWIMRIYIERGWLNEAEFIAKSFHEEDLSDNNLKLFKEAYTQLLLQQQDFERAIIYLEELIKLQNNKAIKRRWHYLLGQLCQEVGKKEKAYNAYKSVEGIGTPYNFVFNAKIKQSEVTNTKDVQKAIASLTSMAKKNKNKDLLDRIYYAKANIYLSLNDTISAIENYILAENKSTKNGYEKALAQISLADIYYRKKEFKEALPRYSEALANLPEEESRINEIKNREQHLSRVVPLINEIQKQDSLQLLAQKSPQEQRRITEEYIALIKKEDKKNRRKEKDEELQERYSERETEFSTTNQNDNFQIQVGGDAHSFYFYSPLVVAQGKTAFEKRWGKRNNEDYWQIKKLKGSGSKSLRITSSDEGDDKKENELGNKENNNISELDDSNRYDVNRYLRNIPSTPEAFKISNNIVEKKLFKLAEIYRDEWNNIELSMDTYTSFLKRFPKSEYSYESHVSLLTMSLQSGDQKKAEEYRQKLIKLFPDARFVAALKKINYEQRLRDILKEEEAVYNKSFKAFKKGENSEVRKAYNLFEENNFISEVAPNMMLINALTYNKEEEKAVADSLLTAIVDNFPKTGISTLASIIKDKLSEGQAIQSMSWDSDNRPNVDSTSTGYHEVRACKFILEQDSSYIALFAYNPLFVDKNALLYAITDYNFSKYERKTFDVFFLHLSTDFLIQIEGFYAQNEVENYLEDLLKDKAFCQNLSEDVYSFYITKANFDILLQESSLDDYSKFYKDELGGDFFRTKILNLEIKEEPFETLPKEVNEISIDKDSIKGNTPYVREHSLPKDIIRPRITDISKKTINLQKIEKEGEPVVTDKKTLSQKEKDKLRKEKVKEQEKLRKQKQKEQEQKRKEREKERK